MPGMHPRNAFAASNTAAFASVRAAPSDSSEESTEPDSRARLMRSSSFTAARVHTAHCPSRPPSIQRSSVVPPTMIGYSVRRSATMLSSLPVYRASAQHYRQPVAILERRVELVDRSFHARHHQVGAHERDVGFLSCFRCTDYRELSRTAKDRGWLAARVCVAQCFRAIQNVGRQGQHLAPHLRSVQASEVRLSNCERHGD
jgi:hypothetical protein